MEYCIEHNILRDFFKTRGDEVIKNMTIDMTFERQIELTKRDYYEDGVADGKAIGLSQGLSQGQTKGELLTLINQVIKKVSKLKTLEQIVEETESTIEEITPIYESVKSNPNLSAEEIYDCLIINDN